MALKEKRYKYIEDVVEDYLYLVDERVEIPFAVKKIKDKYSSLKEEYEGKVLDKEEAEDFFKLFNQEKKIEERATEVETELREIEELLKQFLQYLEGQKFTYEKKDEVEKTKMTHLFWLENGQIKSNRELSKGAKKNRELVA
jgi:ribosomal protein L11 methylase PrmA